MGAARDQGIKTSAVLTSMDHPIGMTVGNSLEVHEAIAALKNEQGLDDLVELVAAQGSLTQKDQRKHFVVSSLSDYEFSLFVCLFAFFRCLAAALSWEGSQCRSR